MQPGFAETVRTFAKIGLLSFGGPAGQIATMHRILVDEKKWLDEERFLHALNFCMLLPGPEAQQLATYAGWLLHRVKGGLAAGILFVAPGFVVMMALAAFYVGFRDLTLVQGLFAGLKPAVLAVVVEACLRIGKRGLKRPSHRVVAVLSFLAIFLFGLPFPLIVAAAGLYGFASTKAEGQLAVVDSPPVGRSLPTILLWSILWLAPVGLALAWGQGAFGAVGLFFAKMAVVTFGGAYSVLAYVAQQAVEVHGWLTPPEMLDGLGLAETTPGPLILVNQFAGFLAGFRDPGPLNPWAGGVLAACLTVWVTFVPSFLWIFAGAPHVERMRGNARLAAALSAITAAVFGVILNLSLWFALHVAFAKVGDWGVGPINLPLPDPASAQPVAIVLGAAAMVALVRLKWGMVPVLAGSAAIGALLY
ncbi:putative chromate transporter (ChrA-like) [Magnetospirillum sp. LM-5]|uniref:chromate efflux transporter n=1 Tax=Magnetospirillum sp. LM-5 TaxID=2681466 RepID=UPI0013858983|nr:chromate efflux transporter [Magnetospirillum sp. LM-5]CAA7612635.1 putative chromate transporter (ChrA-like) [Magnetospirillum sp. LM-5]